MASRQIRSDIKVGTLERKLGLEPGAIRNPDGTDARSDKKLGTLRIEFANSKIKANPKISDKSFAKAKKAVKSLSKATSKAKK